jgi:hypothetical protein
MVLQKRCGIFKLLSCALLAVAGCGGGGAEQAAASRQSIVGGELDTEHTNVFGLVTDEEEGLGACSATLIAPNLLLTARHCVAMDVTKEVVCGRSDLGETHPPSDIFATNDVRFRSESRWFRTAEVHVPSEGDDTCGYDIALVILSESVPTSIATSAVPRIDREVEQGEVYEAVGYGVADSGRSGVRFMRSGLEVACEPGRCGIGVRASEFRGEAGVCEGDSGGPAFDADGKVVGVVSRGGDECSTPVYSTVTAWRDLIVQVAAHAAVVGGYQAPFWVESGLSDPPVVVEPPVPPVVKAGMGEACEASSDCVVGSACHSPAPSSASVCVALCDSDADCEADAACAALDASGAKACQPRTAERETALAATCAFAGAPTMTTHGWAVLALGLGLTLVRRRLRRAAA